MLRMINFEISGCWQQIDMSGFRTNELSGFPIRVPPFSAAPRRERSDRSGTALSIGASADDDPRLLVVNIEGQLDIYDGRSGTYLRTIGALGETPYMVHALN